MEKKPNIKLVAQKANVSTATVSNVMNSSRFVKEETRKKVLEAMEELNYRPSTVAKSLKGKDTKVIGLIIPIQHKDTSAQFFISLSNGVESVLNNEGYRLVIGNSHENLSSELDQIDMFKTQFIDYVDGLIIAPTSNIGSEVNDSWNIDYPVVYVDRKPNTLHNVDTIYTNNYFVTYEAIELMLKKQRNKIAFISGPIDVSSTIERFEAYKDVLKKYRIDLDEGLIFEVESSFQSGYEIASKLLSNHEIDGIVVVNNTISMGVFKYLKEQNIKIPDDLSFLSYDDFDWMELTEPAITTIRQPSFEMGEAAARLMLEKLRDRTKEPTEICIESSIIIRNSL
ncbi:LacI family transcriptional regulator [Bacillus canaveralius]|uniref:LacI family transcriptional regulator n=1 Tax=Bacillus canaveralius TaxID=1403243 RepID=A0A2N5GK16_9BACI|nr:MULTISPECIES: LacI family DNA-binding transcriptional regulator [Bacillus]PLR81656.1 LacI family transcriptional regulator [Bacillus canaveralius]PLR87722.1 LacI family transcriptional regulator [Bacillus sp. V33-4]PLR89880.1 LacI family transcriptional regulator [Bacillus canaveralius]RSK55167.1 LacI family transcriptional regulator [Bacillus canaveralius]